MGNILAWMISFILVIGVLGIVLFQLMCLVDLETDFISPYDSSARINNVVLSEFVTQAVLCFLHLVTGHWVMFLLCIPYAYYNMKLYTERRHLLDVTEIFNLLPGAKKICLYKLGYLSFILICSIFWYLSKRLAGIYYYEALG